MQCKLTKKTINKGAKEMQNSKIMFILGPGHGGISAGNFYLTKGKQSPKFADGSRLYEGEFNRKITKLVHEDPNLFTDLPWNCPANITLKSRIKYVKELNQKYKNCAFLAVHANAAGRRGWSSAHGVVVFYHPANSEGKKLAECILRGFENIEEISTARGVKPCNYAVLRGTRHIPGALVECGFMTNKKEAEFLKSSEGQRKIAVAIRAGLRNFEAKKILDKVRK